MGILFAKQSNEEASPTHTMDLRKGHEAQQNSLLSAFDLEGMDRLEAPGIRTIKQVELFTKWRKHVPDDSKSPLYDNPGEDVILAVKQERKSKKEYATAQ